MKLSGLAIAILFATGLRLMAAPASGSAPPSLTLRDCLEMALVHNPELRTASQQFLSAEGQSIRLHAILYPSVNSQAITTPLTFYVQVNETFYSRATLPQIRLSRLTREQAFLNYRQALVDVLFQVRQAFTTELGARAQTALGKELVAKRQAALKAGQQLFEAGRLHRSDILPLQVLSGLAQQGNTLALLTEQQGTLSLQLAVGTELPANAQLVGNLDDTAPDDLNTRQADGRRFAEPHGSQAAGECKIVGRPANRDRSQKTPTPSWASPRTRPFSRPRSYPARVPMILNAITTSRKPSALAGNTQLPLSLYVTWLIFDGGNLAGIKAGDKAQIASQQVAIDALRKVHPRRNRRRCCGGSSGAFHITSSP